MAKKNDRIMCDRDVTRIVTRAGWTIRNGKGSHLKARSPDGSTIIPYYRCHGSEGYPKGTRCAIEKMLRTAGLLATIIAALLIGGIL